MIKVHEGVVKSRVHGLTDDSAQGVFDNAMSGIIGGGCGCPLQFASGKKPFNETQKMKGVSKWRRGLKGVKQFLMECTPGTHDALGQGRQSDSVTIHMSIDRVKEKVIHFFYAPTHCV